MTLQFLQLQQRQQPSQTWGGGRRPGRSPVSEALTPRGGMTAEQRYAPGFVERQKEEWAMEDKLKKEERDAKVKEAQEMGMRIRDAFEKEKEAGREVSAKVEGDVEAMAMEAYKFAVDEGLDDASRQNILRQLKLKPKAYNFLQKKGLIMADGSDFVRKAGEPVEEEWHYNAEDNLMYNRKTGEHKRLEEMTEKDWDTVYQDIVKSAQSQVKDFLSETFLEGLNSEQRADYIKLEQDTMRNIVATRLWQAGMRDTKKIKEWADAAVGTFDWEAAIKKEKERKEVTEEKEEPERVGIHKNWDAPLDEEKAKGMAEFFRANPDANTPVAIEANRDKYGDATVDRMLGILGEKSTPPPKAEEKPTIEAEVTGVKAGTLATPSTPSGYTGSQSFRKWKGL